MPLWNYSVTNNNILDPNNKNKVYTFILTQMICIVCCYIIIFHIPEESTLETFYRKNNLFNNISNDEIAMQLLQMIMLRGALHKMHVLIRTFGQTFKLSNLCSSSSISFSWWKLHEDLAFSGSEYQSSSQADPTLSVPHTTLSSVRVEVAHVSHAATRICPTHVGF